MHSHVSSPILIFFHSVDRESDWLSALEAVLDAATLMMALTEHEARGAATLMHRVGSRTAARLSELLRVETPLVDPLDQPAVQALADRLAACGYEPVAVDAAVVTKLGRLRADYTPRIRGLAELLGAERPKPLD